MYIWSHAHVYKSFYFHCSVQLHWLHNFMNCQKVHFLSNMSFIAHRLYIVGRNAEQSMVGGEGKQ